MPTHVALTLSSGCLVVRYPLTGSGLFTVFTRVSLTAVWFPRHVPQGSGRAPWNCSRRRRRSTWRARRCWTGNRSWRTAVIFRCRSWAHRARHLGCWGNAGARLHARCNRRRRRSYHPPRWRHLVAGHRATSRTGVSSLLERGKKFDPPQCNFFLFFNLTARDRFNVPRPFNSRAVHCARAHCARIHFPVRWRATCHREIPVSGCPSTFETKQLLPFFGISCWMGIGNMFRFLRFLGIRSFFFFLVSTEFLEIFFYIACFYNLKYF